jgi:hypothetical protein
MLVSLAYAGEVRCVWLRRGMAWQAGPLLFVAHGFVPPGWRCVAAAAAALLEYSHIHTQARHNAQLVPILFRDIVFLHPFNHRLLLCSAVRPLTRSLTQGGVNTFLDTSRHVLSMAQGHPPRMVPDGAFNLACLHGALRLQATIVRRHADADVASRHQLFEVAVAVLRYARDSGVGLQPQSQQQLDAFVKDLLVRVRLSCICVCVCAGGCVSVRGFADGRRVWSSQQGRAETASRRTIVQRQQH